MFLGGYRYFPPYSVFILHIPLKCFLFIELGVSYIGSCYDVLEKCYCLHYEEFLSILNAISVDWGLAHNRLLAHKSRREWLHKYTMLTTTSRAHQNERQCKHYGKQHGKHANNRHG